MREETLPGVLLVDDEPDLLESCARILEDEGIRCVTTTDPRQVVSLMRAALPEVVVTDFKMPGMSGMELLEIIQREYPDIPVIMISAYATIEGVVQAVKLGAFDYVTKPFSADQLVITVRRAMDRRRLKQENDELRQKARRDYLRNNLVGKSPAMAHVCHMILQVAPARTCVMIQGESGAGKRTVAQAIHITGGREGGPFLAVDCAQLNKERIWAFPGLSEAKASLMESARGGTLYLQKVEELSREAQINLSRALQEKSSTRHAGKGADPAHARVVCGSGADLKGMVNEGKFRQDLYFQLNVVNIQMPPLRERREDIAPLCDFFLAEIASGNGAPMKTPSAEFLARLAEYHWPGNVRELMGVVETAAASAAGQRLLASDLPEVVRRHAAIGGMTYRDAREACLGKFERDFLENLLYTSKGNITQASETAGIARMSLYRMIKRNNLTSLASSEREAERAKGATAPGDNEKDYFEPDDRDNVSTDE